MVIDMNVGEKQSGRKKSSSRKKNKEPQRGMSVAQLERTIRLQEMTQIPPLQPFTISSSCAATAAGYTTSSSCTTLPNGGLQFRYGYPPPTTTPIIMFNGSGSNSFGSDRFQKLSSIPNYIKCASDGCTAFCHKKIRIHGGSNASVVNFPGNYSGGVEMIDVGKTRGQVTEYEFFPGKSAATTTWCSGSGGMIGLRGGEGSCVTAVTGGNEEGSVSSVDLSLKLSY